MISLGLVEAQVPKEIDILIGWGWGFRIIF